MSVRHTRFLALFSISATLGFAPLIQAHSPRDAVEHATTAPAPNARLEAASGTVRELVIDDRVANMSVRYVSIVPSAGEATALAGVALDTLADGDTATVTGRRNGNVLFVESARSAKTNAARPAPSEHVEGRLAMAHADDFVTGKSQYFYEVHGDDGRITALKLHGRPEALQPGMKVAAHGNREAVSDKLEASRIEILGLPAEATTTAQPADSGSGIVAKAGTTHSVLVVAFKFSDTATDPMPIASVQNVMTGASNSVANFFSEASYGQHRLNVTVPSAWLRSATTATPTTCNYTTLANAGDAAAATAGYTPTSYEFRVYMFPRVAACGWSGLAYVGSPKQAWINGPSSIVTQVIGHEMGHNFGLLHAASVDCGARAIGGTCTVSEYGDPFSTMGNQRAAHYDAAQKSLLGWIPATSVKTHISGTATYVLSPLETGGGSVYAVKIPATTKRTYWVEYRQPIGFDAFLSSYPNNGAQIRVASPFETLCGGCGAYSDDTQLLDFTTGTTPFTDAALTVGNSYTDSDYGYTISVISATASALTVQVSGPGSTSGPVATSTALASSSNPSTAGSAVTFTASVTGTAPAGTVSFTDNGSAISGCSASALNGTGNTRTATCSTAALAAGTHSIVARYGGDAGNLASTSAPLAQVVNSTVTSTNVALAASGGTATASTYHNSLYPPSAVNNNERAGRNSSAAGTVWVDGTSSVWPDWVQITFNGSKTINRVVVYSMQDNYTAPIEPTDTMTFSKYGLTGFSVQAWNGSTWVTLGTVTGNNLVKRTVTFSAFTTDRIRIMVNSALATWSRITEIEAWGH